MDDPRELEHLRNYKPSIDDLKMKREREKDVKLMADAVDDRERFNRDIFTNRQASTVDPTIGKKLLKADEIIATKELVIPKCQVRPTNGRIFVIEVVGSEMKSPGGLILPPKFGMKKNDQVEDLKRYFVVDWDYDGIPQEILNLLSVGCEVNPMVVREAENYSIPDVIDWNANQIYKVLHYTELAGVSKIKPEKVDGKEA